MSIVTNLRVEIIRITGVIYGYISELETKQKIEKGIIKKEEVDNIEISDINNIKCFKEVAKRLEKIDTNLKEIKETNDEIEELKQNLDERFNIIKEYFIKNNERLDIIEQNTIKH